MKKTIFFGVTNLVFLSSIVFAQVPNPVADNEMRDGNSIRRRAIELERVKRESNKLKPRESTKEQEIKFAEIKEDFENIQKLQGEIIKAYTTGKKINYEKISQSAAEMTKKAVRLDENLFDSKIEETVKNKGSENAKPKKVRELIVELDKAIGVFVGSPVFKNTKLVDEQSSEKSRLDLEKIFRLSDALSRQAKKLQ
jgi:cell fate (sporulation/competence/biofilm development) regulator YlbF (YheA/YmcA/DUF963 family)